MVECCVCLRFVGGLRQCIFVSVNDFTVDSVVFKMIDPPQCVLQFAAAIDPANFCAFAVQPRVEELPKIFC